MGVGRVKPEYRTSQAPLGDLKSAEKPRLKGPGSQSPGLEGWDLEVWFGQGDWSGNHNSRGQD